MSYAAQARRILMSGLVDDAGLVPAASSWRWARRWTATAATCDEADPVLSHRFVCPAARLPELRDHLDPDDRIELSLILDRPLLAGRERSDG